MHIGVAHHFGWAVLVTADEEHRVVDRRRIELVDPGLPAAPIHHRGGAHAMHGLEEVLDDEALGELVAAVRASAVEHANRSLNDLAEELGTAVKSISVRDWPRDFPSEIAELRRPPYESRADSIMYCEVLAGAGADRGWTVRRFDAKSIEREAGLMLDDAADLIDAQRSILGPPWNKDHRIAFAAAILAARLASSN